MPRAAPDSHELADRDVDGDLERAGIAERVGDGRLRPLGDLDGSGSPRRTVRERRTRPASVSIDAPAADADAVDRLRRPHGDPDQHQDQEP